MNTVREDIRVFDVRSYVCKLLLQWRAILCFGIVIGLMVMLGDYWMNAFEYSKSKESLSTSLSVDELESMLTPDEISAVDTAVQEYYRKIDMTDYLANSLYINMNAMSYKQVTVVFQIETYGETTTDDIGGLLYKQKKELLKEKNLNFLSKELGLDDKEEKYIRELLEINTQTLSAGAGQIIVSFAVCEGLDDESVESAIEKVVLQIIGTYSEDLCDILLIEKSVSICVNDDLKAKQIDDVTYLKNNQSWLNNAKAALNETQLLLYTERLNENTVNSGGKNSGEIVTPSPLNVGMFTKFFVASVIVYCMFYAIYILFSEVIVCPEVDKIINVPILGIIRLSGQRKTRFFSWLFFDGLLYKILFRNEVIDAKYKNIVGYMQNYDGGKASTKFQILQPGFDMKKTSEMETFLSVCTSFGLDIDLISVDVTDVKSVVDILDKSIPVIIAIYKKKTLKNDFRRLVEILNNQSIRITGELCVEDIG